MGEPAKRRRQRENSVPQCPKHRVERSKVKIVEKSSSIRERQDRERPVENGRGWKRAFFDLTVWQATTRPYAFWPLHKFIMPVETSSESSKDESVSETVYLTRGGIAMFQAGQIIEKFEV